MQDVALEPGTGRCCCRVKPSLLFPCPETQRGHHQGQGSVNSGGQPGCPQQGPPLAQVSLARLPPATAAQGRGRARGRAHPLLCPPGSSGTARRRAATQVTPTRRRPPRRTASRPTSTLCTSALSSQVTPGSARALLQELPHAPDPWVFPAGNPPQQEQPRGAPATLTSPLAAAASSSPRTVSPGTPRVPPGHPPHPCGAERWARAQAVRWGRGLPGVPVAGER